VDVVEKTAADIVDLATILGMTGMQIVGMTHEASAQGLAARAEKQGKTEVLKTGQLRLAATRANLLVKVLLEQGWPTGSSLAQPVVDISTQIAICASSQTWEEASKTCPGVAEVGGIGVKIKMQTLVNAPSLVGKKWASF